jgi:hypothetical protein
MNSRSQQNLHLRIGSLNCRSLEKIHSPSILPSFSRFLRQQPIQLYAFQEVSHRSSTIDISASLNLHLQSQSASLWGKHCGLVSRDPAVKITPIHFYPSSRYIIATISHDQRRFSPFTIINVYAPHQRALQRAFYEDLFQQIHAHFQTPTDGALGLLDPRRTIIVGDFNLSSWASLSTRSSTHPWATLIGTSFTNVFANSDLEHLPTFQRGLPGNSYPSFSTIDFMFVSNDLVSHAQHCASLFVNASWTDHSLLSFDLMVGASDTGPGLWRANPAFARSDHFCQSLSRHLGTIASMLDPELSAQAQWDSVKASIIPFIRQFGRNKKKKTYSEHRHLQRERNKFHRRLKLDPHNDSLIQRILSLDTQLSTLQDDIIYVAALKAGIKWLEKGEKSAGYLKRTANLRQNQTKIHSIQHPLTSVSCTTPDSMQDATTCFYSQLYSSDAITPAALDQMTAFIPPTSRCSALESSQLQSPFSLDDIQAACYSPTKQSSPGKDGLPYDILRLLLCDPSLTALVTQVYNQALSGLFPSSWQETCVTLLPKKGDLSLLSNWRPISLINTDAKVFTRLMTQRFQPVCQRLINPFQTGFVKDRFIGDNGALVKCIMDDAKMTNSAAFGLMLDQEKAYDRVHPQYLSAVLLQFGFPPPSVLCLVNLFFNTKISFNVNGFISSPIHQQRGLRQGDPLSPLLFNLAFEPFLLGLTRLLPGYDLTPRPLTDGLRLPSVRFTAYADDVLVLCTSTEDFDSFQTLYKIYGLASNAKLNPSKSVALTLTGQAPPPLLTTHLATHGITRWYSQDDPDPLIYLGYPILYNRRQRNTFMDKLTLTVKHHTDIHRSRQLSILGRATVLNTLVLSKIWHSLRFLPVSHQQLQRLRSVLVQFTSRQNFPAIGYAKLIQPKKDGGLGLLDPFNQLLALQVRLLRSLLSPLATMPPIHQILAGFVRKQSHQADPAIPFFYAKFRGNSDSNSANSLCHLLYRSFDALPRLAHHDLLLSPASWLCMPLGPFLLHTDGDGTLVPGPFFHRSPISAILSLRPDGPGLAWKDSTQLSAPYRSLSLSLQDGTLRFPAHLQRHLSDPRHPDAATATLSSLSDQLLQLPCSFSGLSTKVFRSILPLPPNVHLGRTDSIPLPPTKWSLFWRWTMPHRVRNVWYRYLHNCLSAKAILHRRVPTLFLSPLCPICSLCPEDPTHLMFLCPVKSVFWSAFMHEFFTIPTDSTSAICPIIMSTLSLPPVSNTGASSLSSHQVFTAALHSVWQAHWRFVFDEHPITSQALRLSTYQKLTILLHQQATKSSSFTSPSL